MKFNKSKDGLLRATVRISYRVSEVDLEIVAFVADYEGGDDLPKPRRANRREMEAAIRSGYFGDDFWNEAAVEAYYDSKRTEK